MAIESSVERSSWKWLSHVLRKGAMTIFYRAVIFTLAMFVSVGWAVAQNAPTDNVNAIAMSEAQEHYRTGVDFVGRQDLSSALRQFDQAIALHARALQEHSGSRRCARHARSQ